MSSLLIGGIAALAAAAFLLTRKDGEKKGEVSVKKGDGLTVPYLTPPSVLSIPMGVYTEAAPAVFNVPPGQGDDTFILAFADQTMLYDPKIQGDYVSLAGALAMKGYVTPVEYATQRVADYKSPAYYRTLKFDSDLDPGVRASIFWAWLAHKWDALKIMLGSARMAPFPIFRQSVWDALQPTIWPGEVAPWANKGGELIDKNGGDPFEYPDKKQVTPSKQKGGYPDMKGPATLPNGQYVPKGGSIEGGIPYYVMQPGIATATMVAQEWRKQFPATWAPCIAGTSGKTWGQGGNVNPGDKIRMPLGILDPDAVCTAKQGQKTGVGGQKGDKPYPDNEPPPGHVWVFMSTPTGGEWVAVPVGTVDQSGDPDVGINPAEIFPKGSPQNPIDLDEDE